MGQYYTPLVIDEKNKIKTLEPRHFGSVKLMESAWINNDMASAVYSLIHNNPCRVAWIGDYSGDPYEPENDAYAKDKMPGLLETVKCYVRRIHSLHGELCKLKKQKPQKT